MSECVKCEHCGKEGRRGLGRIAAEGWLYLETTIDDENGNPELTATGEPELLLVRVCSRECATNIWHEGPGRLDLSIATAERRKRAAMSPASKMVRNYIILTRTDGLRTRELYGPGFDGARVLRGGPAALTDADLVEMLEAAYAAGERAHCRAEPVAVDTHVERVDVMGIPSAGITRAQTLAEALEAERAARGSGDRG